LPQQWLALVSYVTGLDMAYMVVQFVAILLLTLGVYRFARLWVDPRAASLAALASVFLGAESFLVYSAGQLSTTFAAPLYLNAMPYLYQWARRGGWRSFLKGVTLAVAAAALPDDKRLIAQMGRPAAYLKDGGSELHKAVDELAERGLASPCIDDISHAAAGMLKRVYQHHPAFERFVSACGRVSGKLKHTLLACLAPPTVRTKARFMNVHRLVTWAQRLLQLSPAGGAKAGSILARLRACLAELPACKDLIKRFGADAQGLLECQKILKTKGLSHDTLAQCKPRISAMPSAPLRLEFGSYLEYQLATAKTLGLDHVGMPISSDAIESLFGVAKRHGVGQTQDAARIALRLPALCGAPTREEAEQVLGISVARQQAITGQFTSLTKQRREVLGHREALESLGRSPGGPSVELLPRPKNRSNHQNIVNLSNNYEELYGPQLRNSTGHRLLAHAASPGRRETALTS
jgi:hypothetical protein